MTHSNQLETIKNMRGACATVLALLLAGCATLPSPSLSATASGIAVPLLSPTATPSGSATLVPLPIGSASPGDAATAAKLVKEYENRLIGGDWRGAWALLAPEAQIRWRAFDDFKVDRTAYFKEAGDQYAAKDPVHDAAQIRQWVVPENYPAAPIYPATAVYDHAFLVEVDYPKLATNNAGWDVLLIAPDGSGEWRVWDVR